MGGGVCCNSVAHSRSHLKIWSSLGWLLRIVCWMSAKSVGAQGCRSMISSAIKLGAVKEMVKEEWLCQECLQMCWCVVLMWSGWHPSHSADGQWQMRKKLCYMVHYGVVSTMPNWMLEVIEIGWISSKNSAPSLSRIDNGWAIQEVLGGGSPAAREAIMVGVGLESCST